MKNTKHRPKVMRYPRKAGRAHYYIDPKGIAIYPNGLMVVVLTRRQIEQIANVYLDYVPSGGTEHG